MAKKLIGGDKGVVNIILIVSIIFMLMIFIVSSYLLFKNAQEDNEINDSVEELIEDVIVENTNDEDTKTPTIEWNKLKEINKDIIGWIKIEGTNINYPILKSNDLYYLKHTYDKKYNSNGSIFTLDLYPFKNKVTTIYGHNMKNNLMFSELGKYLDKDFLYSHRNIEIYTEELNYKATIFSCYSIDVNVEENNIKKLDFAEEIEYYKKASVCKTEDIGNIEKVIKLCTCSYLNTNRRPTNKRYYIVAKIEVLD